MTFFLNGYKWRIIFVNPYSHLLVDRTGRKTVATTDPSVGCVFIANDIYGSFLTRVLIHEIGHCVMVSYDLIGDIHRMVRPAYWIEAEEWVCNFIAEYGEEAITIAYAILDDLYS